MPEPSMTMRPRIAIPPIGQGLAVVVSIALVGVAMGAGVGLYLLSLHVAARNAQTAAIDARIAATRRQVEQLRMELGFRSRFVELQRWSTPLGLQPAAGEQYAPGAAGIHDTAHTVTLRTEQPAIPLKPCQGTACQGASRTANHGYTPAVRKQMDSLVGDILN